MTKGEVKTGDKTKSDTLVKLVCNLTGEVIAVYPDYYNSKIKQYGSEDLLKKYYLQSKLISMIQRGHSLDALSSSFGFVLDPEKEDYYHELIDFHKKSSKFVAKTKENKSKINFLKTDDSVKEFITRLAKTLNN